MVSASEVLRHLTNLDYPAQRDDVIREAERQDAPPDVVKALRGLPLVSYRNDQEIVRSADLDPAPERDRAQRAVQARDRHERVAQHLRGR